jgi:hypothetical protein
VLTTYDEALARTGGTRKEKTMALYCAAVIPRLGGTFDPRLVWRGAVAADLSLGEFRNMVDGQNWAELHALQDMARDVR